MLQKELGLRLKLLRHARRFSLRSVARASGVAVSFLSALERGRTTVSVARLKTILDVLGMSLGAFFSLEPAPPEKIVYHHAELVEVSGQKRGISYLDVAAGRQGRLLQLLLESYAPGADTGHEFYRHDAEEAGLVIKGRLEITVGDEVFVLGPGDAYYFDSRHPHRFRNVGRGRAQAVSVNTPPSF